MKRITGIILAVMLAVSCFITGVYAEPVDSQMQADSAGETVQEILYDDIEIHWAKEYITYVAEKGFMFSSGGENTFCPEEGMTRAMLVSSLHAMADRLAEESEHADQTAEGADASAQVQTQTESSEKVIYGVEGTSGLLFSDMTGSEPYAADVKWAVENGIINGIDGAFCSDLTVDRQTVAVMLYRFSGAVGITLQEDWLYIMEYNDIEDIDIWAVDGIAYCGMTGLMSGDTQGNFNPKKTLTRAEASAVLYRLYESAEKDPADTDAAGDMINNFEEIDMSELI